jgi:outer membrane lipoprotein-sorting protein
MSKLAALVAVLALLATRPVAAPAAEAANPDADAIVKKGDLSRQPSNSYIWKVTITTEENGKPPMLNAYDVYMKDNRMLARFLAPPRDVGRSLLGVSTDLWVYLPDTHKALRVPASQRLVGQVANGDLARANFSGDYSATWLATEEVDGVLCDVLDLKPKTKEATYDRVKYWVAREGARPKKAEFYAGTGTLLKYAVYENYQTVNGRSYPARAVFTDAIRKDRVSVMEFSDVRVKNLADRYFSKDYMQSLE